MEDIYLSGVDIYKITQPCRNGIQGHIKQDLSSFTHAWAAFCGGIPIGYVGYWEHHINKDFLLDQTKKPINPTSATMKIYFKKGLESKIMVQNMVNEAIKQMMKDSVPYCISSSNPRIRSHVKELGFLFCFSQSKNDILVIYPKYLQETENQEKVYKNRGLLKTPINKKQLWKLFDLQ